MDIDLSVQDNVYKLYEITKDKEVDILINNAGFGLFGNFVDTDLSRELNMINLNIVAVHILTKLFLVDFVKKNKVNGYFYHDGLEWNCPFVDDYAVTATPSFYLLDKEKKIIFKPFDFNELVDFVKIIKQ